MKSADIKQTLLDFVTSDSASTILIDGEWGVGKTYQIKEAIRELAESQNPFTKNISYISLYGLKKVGDLSACYRITVPTLFKQLIKTGAPFAPLVVPICGNQIADALDSAVSFIPDGKKIRAKRLFVFDDLERVDPSLSYIQLYGFFNTLLLNGCRILCVASTNHVSGKRRAELLRFEEKSFRRIVQINEKPVDVMKSILEKHGCPLSDRLLSESGSNLRNVERVCYLYNSIKNRDEHLWFSVTKMFSEEQVLLACVAAVKVVFEHIETPKPTDSYGQSEYSLYVEKYGRVTGPRLLSACKNSLFVVDSNQPFVGKLIKSVVSFYLWNDFGGFHAFEPAKGGSLLDLNYFLLGDADKALYRTEFIHKIKEIGNRPMDERMKTLSVEWLLSDDLDILVAEEPKIKELLFDLASEDESFVEEIRDQMMFLDEPRRKEKNDSILEPIRIMAREKEDARFLRVLRAAETDREYKKMTEVIDAMYQYIRSHQTQLRKTDEYLMDHSFLLPDLSASITQLQWEYCHRVQVYAFSAGMGENFNALLQAVKNEYRESNSCLAKCAALMRAEPTPYNQ